MLRLFSLLLLLLGGFMGCAAEQDAGETATEPLGLYFHEEPTDEAHGTLDVVGLDPAALERLADATLSRQEWTALLAVYTGEALPDASEEIPPMLGSYSITEGRLRFTPRFPLVEGLAYTARFNSAQFAALYGRAEVEAERAAPLVTTFGLAKEAVVPSTVVTQVYPTADVLPMNQLKMYLHFSAPMRRGEAYDHLYLLDAASGDTVADPFVIIEQELWDAERTRFTLLFDPGRIKRDIRPNLELGLPLQEGNQYHLVVDAAWRDAAGAPLKEPFEKPFAVTAADRTSPNPTAWQLTPPAPGSTDPLAITFDEPLDHALLHRLLTVRDAEEQALEGTIEVLNEETQWRFIPAQPWRAGAYAVEVAAILEDLAGNNLRNLFDVDLNEEQANRDAEQVPIRLPFQVQEPGVAL